MRDVFGAGRYITWASGRGLGPGNGEFFGKEKLSTHFSHLLQGNVLLIGQESLRKLKNHASALV